jgi:hypothetical protein
MKINAGVITHGDVPKTYAYELCQCYRCKVIEQCTPRFDFFTRTKDGPTGPLFCYACLLADANVKDAGYTTTKFELN